MCAWSVVHLASEGISQVKYVQLKLGDVGGQLLELILMNLGAVEPDTDPALESADMHQMR